MGTIVLYPLKLAKCGIVQEDLSGPPSESFQIFSVIPPFGLSVTTDPPFYSPKNQVIPPKILRPPPAPRR